MKIIKAIRISSLTVALANVLASLFCLAGCQIVADKADDLKEHLENNINLNCAVVGEVMDNLDTSSNEGIKVFFENFELAQKHDFEFYKTTVENAEDGYLTMFQSSFDEYDSLKEQEDMFAKVGLGTAAGSFVFLGLGVGASEIEWQTEKKKAKTEASKNKTIDI